jgi:peptide deformylase
MKFELKIWPDPVLNRRLQPAKLDDPELSSAIGFMRERVDQPDAAGLAANQIGYLGRVIVVKLFARGIVTMINPKITQRLGAQRTQEGCLSLPGIQVPVLRAEEVAVEYHDDDLQERAETLTGRDAVVVQHEIDHLDGKTLADQPGVKRWGDNAKTLKSLMAEFKERVDG